MSLWSIAPVLLLMGWLGSGAVAVAVAASTPLRRYGGWKGVLGPLRRMIDSYANWAEVLVLIEGYNGQ